MVATTAGVHPFVAVVAVEAWLNKEGNAARFCRRFPDTMYSLGWL